MKIDNSPARGSRDLLPAAVRVRDHLSSTIAEVYRRFGYERIETPALENIDRLTRGEGGDNEKLVYRVLRRGLPDPVAVPTPLSELVDLGLRYDLTVPLSRFYGLNRSRLPVPFRSFQLGPVWRAERPQKDRYRQFHQCDIDLVGEPSVLAEVELIEATTEALDAVGIGDGTVRLSDRRFLSALASRVGVPAGAAAGYFVILDKLDKIGWDGVGAQLRDHGYDDAVATRTIDVLGSLDGGGLDGGGPDAVLGALADAVPGIDDAVLRDLGTTMSCLDDIATGRGGDGAAHSARRAAWRFDPTLVRGMGYYTGQIFEITHPAVAGSIAGGGRYDELIGRSVGAATPACGFSIGFERIAQLLAVVPAPDSVALLHEADVPLRAVLDAARRLRSAGRSTTVVPRLGRLGAQLERLRSWGFTSVVTLDGADPAGDRLPRERSLVPTGAAPDPAGVQGDPPRARSGRGPRSAAES